MKHSQKEAVSLNTAWHKRVFKKKRQVNIKSNKRNVKLMCYNKVLKLNTH